jgi:hypothetical protein
MQINKYNKEDTGNQGYNHMIISIDTEKSSEKI